MAGRTLSGDTTRSWCRQTLDRGPGQVRDRFPPYPLAVGHPTPICPIIPFEGKGPSDRAAAASGPWAAGDASHYMPASVQPDAVWFGLPHLDGTESTEPENCSLRNALLRGISLMRRPGEPRPGRPRAHSSYDALTHGYAARDATWMARIAHASAVRSRCNAPGMSTRVRLGTLFE